MKINVTAADYTWYGLGGNGYNFAENIIPRINKWLVEEYIKSKKDYNLQEVRILADKLYRITKIIDEGIDD